MDKSVLKIISVTTTVVGAIATVAGAIAGMKITELEIEEKVGKAIDQISK